MKISILSTLISLTVISCNKPVQQQVQPADTVISITQKKESPKEISLKFDSIKIEDSAKVSPRVVAVYKQKSLLFKGLEKPVLDSLYSNHLFSKSDVLNDYSRESVQNKMNKLKDEYYAETKKDLRDYQPGSNQTWDKVSAMNVKSNENGILTIKYDGYGYTGGAHGYAFENYKVADLKNQKIVKLEDIVDVKKVNWNKIILEELAKRDLQVFDKKDVNYTENFYFDRNQITFVYQQYEIAAYVYGIIPVSIPFSEISDALKPEFKTRMNIK